MNEDGVHTLDVGDLVDAIRRGAGGARDEAGRIIDQLRERYAEAQRRRALRLAAFVGVAYLLLRK